MHDVGHLSNNNRPTSTIEEAFVRRLLAEDDQSLANLNADIAIAQQILDDLKAKQYKLEQRRLAYIRIISPLRRLPPELLSEIIQLATLSSDTFGTIQGRRQILNFASVCKDWREVTMATSILFTSIHLSNCSFNDIEGIDDAVRSIELAEMWFAFSGNRPLTFSIILRVSENSVCPELQRFLITQSNWRSLSIYGDCDAFFHWFFSSSHPPISGEVLEELSLEYPYGSPFNPTRDGPIHLRCSTPRLTRVKLRFRFPITVDAWHLPWAQIIELEIKGGQTTRDSLNILRECPKLESCKFIFDNITRFEDAGGGSIVLLPNLRRLHLTDIGIYKNLSPMCSSLLLPALDNLLILSKSEIVGSRPVLELIKRSRCNLRKLDIEMSNLGRSGVFNDEEITALLLHTPDVIELTIHSSDSSCQFLRFFETDLKKLESLEIFISITRESRNHFTQFVQPRHPDPSKRAPPGSNSNSEFNSSPYQYLTPLKRATLTDLRHLVQIVME